MTELKLTEERIAAAMAKADARVCVGNPRCFALPDPVYAARESCTAKGRCKVGWIAANSGRDAWDVWLDLHTGEGRLRRQVD